MTLDPSLIGAVSALGGVLVGAFAESLRARFAFRREKTWAIVEERRAHLEQVYEAVEEVRQAYGLYYADTLHLMAVGGPSTIKQPSRPVPWSHLKMLVFMYLPELKDDLAELERAGLELGSALADCIMQRSANVLHNQALVAAIDRASNVLNMAVDAMRDTIVQLAEAGRVEKAKSVGRRLKA